MTQGRTRCIPLAAALAAACAAPTVVAVPEGYVYDRVFEGLNLPTSVEFARDGRVFVAEQRGVVKVFDNILDTTPDVFADLRTSVHVFGDRGLIGMALHPDFPEQPYVYVTYAYDGGIGADDAPRWGSAGADQDDCVPPATNAGCPIGGRLSRLTAQGNVAVEETVLIEDWYQQFTFHSIGMPGFGKDGQLYVSGGEGAYSETVDFGQFVTPIDPDTGSPPEEGGSLRVQDLETDGDPLGLSGSLIRVDPLTGMASADNPMAGLIGVSENQRRMLAYGLRNPFRFTVHPQTGEVFLADVGEKQFEEINRIPAVADLVPGTALNFGWPCYEGPNPHPAWQSFGSPICQRLYDGLGRNPATPPFHAYGRVDGGSITGIAFYSGALYPQALHGALFFVDYTSARIYAMADANGDDVPDGGAAVQVFAEGADGIVELQAGPGGDLFFTKFNFGGDPTANSRIERIRFGDNRAPSAALVLAAGSSWTGGPRSVTFDASRSLDPDTGSTDPEQQGLAYAWDLDGDGVFQQGVPDRVFADGFETEPEPVGMQATGYFATEGRHRVALRVTDADGASDTVSMDIIVGNTAPSVQVLAPAANAAWASGTQLTLEATALDLEDGSLPDSAYQWDVTLMHCPDSVCHAHPQTGASGRTASFTPPGHGYPAYLSIQASATDADGATGTTTLDLAPATVHYTLQSSPAGAPLTLGTDNGTGSLEGTVIVGSPISVGAAASFESEGTTWTFSGWSNGQPRFHTLTPEAAGEVTLTATYTSD